MNEQLVQTRPEWATFHSRISLLTRHLPTGTEYWSARDLQIFYEYSSWQKFEAIITRAVESLKTAGLAPEDHFNPTVKLIETGKGASREVLDFQVSRLGCYHLAMVADPVKEQAAFGRLYFAAQTHYAEQAQHSTPALPDDPILAQLQLLAQVRQAQLVTDQKVIAIEHRLDAAPITSERVGEIHRLGKHFGHVMGNYQSAWRLFKDRFGLASYRDLPNNRYEEAVRFLNAQISAYAGQSRLENP